MFFKQFSRFFFPIFLLVFLIPLLSKGQAESLPYSALSTQLKTQSAPLVIPLKKPKIVIHKAKRQLLLYSGNKLLRSYPIGLGFNPVGIKLKQGDGRTPEGNYFITMKNPKSQYYLSLAISYPNVEDGKRALKKKLITKEQYRAIVRAKKNKTNSPWYTPLGGEIFIHGHGSKWDWTLGCVALDNPDMKELYQAVEAGTPVTILP